MVGRHQWQSGALRGNLADPADHEFGGAVNEVRLEIPDGVRDLPVERCSEPNVRIRRKRNARDIDVVVGDAEVVYEMADASRRVGRIPWCDNRDSPSAFAQSGDGERSDD